VRGLAALDDANALAKSGKHAEALVVLDRAIREAERNESDIMMAAALYQRSRILCGLTRLDESKVEARRGREAAERAHARGVVALCLTVEAQVSMQMNDIEEADTLSQRAEREARAASDTSALGLAMTIRASILRLQGKREEAAELLRVAESELASVGSADEAIAVNDRGVLLLDGGDAQGALPFFRRAAALFAAAGNAGGSRTARHNIAKALQRSGATDPAAMIAIHAESELLFRDVGDVEGEGFAVNNQGVALMQLGRFQEALEMFARAEDQHERAGITGGIDLARRNKAMALEALQQLAGPPGHSEP
jgi:tetratricopeptide (TPR) repeat protein